MILHYDWEQVARLLLTSRALDTLEETELLPSGEVTYQFSAGGHELAQILLALSLDHPHDGAAVYYRSRPFMLTLGLTVEEALASSMAREGSFTGGRDVGVVFHRVGNGGVTVLPMSGSVGTQFTPVVGWAQGARYRAQVLGEEDWQGAIGVVSGGDGAVASNGFWSALTIATTLKLPVLFFIEDNGYAISVKSDLQTPGRDITKNLASFTNLTVFNADGCDPADAAANIGMAVSLLRTGEGPVLLRVSVPRLPGHSSVDNQAYKSVEERLAERARDPLKTLHDWLVPDRMTEEKWQELANEAQKAVEEACDVVRATASPDPATATTHVFFEDVLQQQGGLAPEGRLPSMGDERMVIESPIRMNLVDAIRKTLDVEMALNPRILLFGEDVGNKGGVHGATRGLQAKFGEERVFDTSLNEEGIMGRAIGMAIAGLLPLPEIQFRKYLDPATEQTNDIGTIRWRTVNNFAAPMVMRIPGGFSKRIGDPWHSVSDESVIAHKPGWQIAMPSNAQDAVGLLRTALRSNDPTFFFEHRNLLDNIDARRPYPGDSYCLPFGKAAILKKGRYLTVVTWAAMVYRCLEAAESFGDEVEVLDLRTIIPWDKEAVLTSVQKTARCLIVHEDCGTAGFGAEIAATIAQEGFIYLDAPIHRLTGADCPMPYNPVLTQEVVPSVKRIREAMKELLSF